MELHERLYEERFSTVVLLRIIKVILVFLSVCILTANVYTVNPTDGQNISSISEKALPAGAEAVSNGGSKGAEAVVPEKSAAVLSQETEAELEAPAAIVPEIPVVTVSETLTAAVPDESAAAVQESPVAAAPAGPAVSVPDSPTAVIPEEPEAIVPEDPSVSVPDVPAAVVPPENTVPGTAPGVINGFLVDKSGVIYGISDPDLVVNDGYLEFPAEGCTGIAAGTFGGSFPSVREIFIPANITYIEEGAFSGLRDMEWFETGSDGTYYTEEGVLFSEGGTCLLAFPAGRTGNYKVPSCVVRFAAGAFDCARIEVLDATACTLTDSSGLPGNISLLVRETP